MNIGQQHRVAQQAKPAKWTVLYVMNGDNDLREAATLDLLNLDEHGSPEDVHVVGQLYRGELDWSWKNLGRKLKNAFREEPLPVIATDWRGMRIFEVRKAGGDEPTKPVAAADGKAKLRPSDPTNLEEFLAWGMEKYPAEHYAVVLSGHGSPQGIMSDSKGQSMSFPEAAKALESASRKVGKDVDVVLMDSCATEGPAVKNAFESVVNHLVTSPQIISGHGFSEQTTLDFLASTPNATPTQLAESFLGPGHNNVGAPVHHNFQK